MSPSTAPSAPAPNVAETENGENEDVDTKDFEKTGQGGAVNKKKTEAKDCQKLVQYMRQNEFVFIEQIKVFVRGFVSSFCICFGSEVACRNIG